MYYETELTHHGILGQKWGVRRFQNKDGSLTDAGRRRNRYDAKADRSDAYWDDKASQRSAIRAKNRAKIERKYDKKISKVQKDIDSYDSIKNGLKNKKGRDILTKDDVTQMRNALIKQRDSLDSKKKSRLDNFDAGTNYINGAYSNIKERSSKYLRMKAEAKTNPSIKATDEYKQAKVAYRSEQFMSAMYSTNSRVLIEASDIASGKRALGAFVRTSNIDVRNSN